MRQDPERRVVVTGIGWVTPLGSGRREVWESLLEGRVATGPVRSFDTSAYPVDRGGEVSDFEPAAHVRRRPSAALGRASQLAVAAARAALDDAGLGESELDAERTGVVMGTTSGEPLEVERFNDLYVADRVGAVRDELVSRYPCHLIAAHVADELGLEGFNMMIPAACAAGNYAVAQAVDVLRSGRAGCMLAGGADAFSRITFTGFARLGAIAPERCQPFDRERRGMIPGEGAAVLVLEPLAAARRREARIYAEVGGYGLSCDAHHMTAAHPEGDGAARAMARALAASGLDAERVSYISAHGTGTPTNDKLESRAVHRLFGEAARRLPMSSIKSMLGHTMGAASAIESAVCSLAVYENRIPPTANFEQPDPDCDVDCVPNQGRELRVEVAMNNAYAFGGNNASVVFTKVSA